MPTPKYFSAKSILPENWSVIATEYFIHRTPSTKTKGDRMKRINVVIKLKVSSYQVTKLTRPTSLKLRRALLR